MTDLEIKRVSFFVDGFNLYHSIRAAEKLLAENQLKWLDLKALCRSFLPLMGHQARLGEIHPFQPTQITCDHRTAKKYPAMKLSFVH